MEKWKRELEISASFNKRFVLPMVQEWLQSKIESVEDARADHRIIKLLDSFAGIDAIEVNPNKGIRGIALRCQWISNVRFDSFSVRTVRASGANTEFGKRLFQLISNQGWLYPELTVQSYFQKTGKVRTEKLLSIGMARTRDIFQFIQLGERVQRFTAQDGNQYTAVPWDAMREDGYDIKIYRS